MTPTQLLNKLRNTIDQETEAWDDHDYEALLQYLEAEIQDRIERSRFEEDEGE